MQIIHRFVFYFDHAYLIRLSDVTKPTIWPLPLQSICKYSNAHNFHISSLQCYSVLSDILVKNELCIPLERGSNVLSTGKGFICLSPPSKL